jgi:GNAT superfamily N-acetyltransferase
MRIRPAQLADAFAIAGVHVASWREAYAGILPDDFLAGLTPEGREPMWQAILGEYRERHMVYVAERDEGGDIVGFASGGAERDGIPGYSAELFAIYVLQSAQGKGTGRQLAAAVARDLLAAGHESLLVWVLADNPSRGFYEALGGQYVTEKNIEIGGVTLVEVSYGWPDIRLLI